MVTISPTENTKGFWKKVLAHLQITTDRLAYKTVISTIKADNYTEESLDLICSTEVFKKILEKRYKNVIQEAVDKIAKKQLKLNIVVGQQQSINQAAVLGPLFETKTNPEELLIEKFRKAGLSPKFTFETYVQGKNNQLAYAIASAVADKPGEIYNPVFFYSGVGLGKTHLMQAIGTKILKNIPSLKIIYTTGESFTNELIESIKGKGRYTANEFRDKYRKADVLLIDDIQFIAGKEATQDEFFHTFNTLHMAQKQIVITSDRPPRDFKNIAERITSRFNSGIIADIQPPDYETRSAILRAKRDKNHDPISNEIIDAIAQRIDTNIRELEGAYLRVLTEATTSGRIPQITDADKILNESRPQEGIQKPVNMNHILKAICSYYSVKAADLKGERRTKDLVLPRQVTMYLIKEMTNTPYISIGEFLGSRDHTTIMHGVEKISNEAGRNGKLKQDLVNVKHLINTEA